jgi:hypothetical protein
VARSDFSSAVIAASSVCSFLKSPLLAGPGKLLADDDTVRKESVDDPNLRGLSLGPRMSKILPAVSRGVAPRTSLWRSLRVFGVFLATGMAECKFQSDSLTLYVSSTHVDTDCLTDSGRVCHNRMVVCKSQSGPHGLCFNIVWSYD